MFWLNDEQWKRIEPHLPRDMDDRRVISGIVRVLKSGCRWCDCPPEYGPSTTIYNRFVRWARRGVWESLFRELAGHARSTDTQMIDSTHVKAHRSAVGGKRGEKQAVGRSRAASSRPPPPSNAINSCRLLSSIGDFLPYALRRRLARALSLPHIQLAAGRPASPWGKPEMF
jgi:transposase